MADDLATLGLRIQSQDVDTTNQRLDAFSQKATQGQKATDALARSSQQAFSQTRQMADAIAQQNTVLATQAKAQLAAATAANGNSAAVMALGKNTAAAAEQARAHAQAQTNVTNVLGLGSKAAANASNQHKALANSLGLTAFQMQQIAIQAPDVVQGLLSGQRPLQVLIQQGGQVAQIMGMGPNGFGGVLSVVLKLLPGLLGFGAVATVFGVVASAVLAGRKEFAELNNTLAVTNGYSGVTDNNFGALTQRIATASNTAVGSTKQTVMDLAAQGQFAGQTLEQAGVYVQKFSALTGQDAAKVVGSFSSMREGVTAFAIQHTNAYHDLTQAQVDYIAKLESEGRWHDAELQYFRDANTAMQKHTTQYGYIEGAVKKVTDAASKMWDALLGLGKPKTLDQQISDLQGVLEKNRFGQQLKSAGFGVAPAMSQGQVTNTVDQMALLSFKADQERVQARTPAPDVGNPIAAQSQTSAQQSAIDTALAARAQAEAGLTADVQRQADLQKKALSYQTAADQARLQQQLTDLNLDKSLNDAQRASIAGAMQRAAGTTAQVNADRARQIDLQTQDALQKQATDLAGANLDAQSSVLQAQAGITTNIQDRWTIETTLLNLADQKAILDQQSIIASAKLGQATEEQAKAAQVQIDAINAAHGAKQQVIDQQKLVDTIHEQAGLAQDALQNQMNVLSAQEGLTTYTSQRVAIERQLLLLNQELARSKAQEVLDAALATGDAAKVSQALADQQALLKVQNIDIQAFDLSAVRTSFSNLSSSIDNISSSFTSHDWPSAINSLYEALGSFGVDLTKLGGMVGDLAKAAPEIATVAKVGGQLSTALTSAFGGNKKVSNDVGSVLGAVPGFIAGLIFGDGGKAQRASEDQAATQAAQALQQAQETRQQQEQQQEITLATLAGDTLQVTNLQRSQELAGLDAANQARQQEIYAIQDELDALQKVIDARQADVDAATKAVAAAETALRTAYTAAQQAFQAQIDAVSTAQDQLRQAYQAQASDLQATIDKFQSFSDSLAQFRQQLSQGAAISPQAAYGSSRSSLIGLQQQIAGGDTSGLGNVQDIVNAFLQASQSSSTTSLQYRSDQALAMQVVGQAKTLADAQVSAAQQQLDAVTAQVSLLIDLNTGVMTVVQAINALNAAQATADQAQAQLNALNAQINGLQALDGNLGILNGSVLAVGDAILGLQTALTQQAAANAALTAAQQALQQAQNNAAPAAAPGPALTTFTTPNYVYYVENNPDLKAQFQAQTGYARGRNEADYGLQMWTNFNNAGRQFTPYGQMFADGGVFTNSVVNKPTAFSMGLMGEAGPEAIMPLHRGADGSLGVRAANGNSGWSMVVDELEALRAEVAAFRRDAKQGRDFVKAILDLFRRVTLGGNSIQVSEAA